MNHGQSLVEIDHHTRAFFSFGMGYIPHVFSQLGCSPSRMLPVGLDLNYQVTDYQVAVSHSNHLSHEVDRDRDFGPVCY